MIGLESYPKQQERVLARQAAETLVLLNLEDGQYFALNEVGGRVWELCDGTRNVAEIVVAIGADYSTPADLIQSDILELLRELSDEKLVVAVK